MSLSLNELQELHLILGVAIENCRDGVMPTIADLERARELASIAVSDAESQGHPITRFFKGSGTPGSTTLTLDDLMDENADFEDSAWVYLHDMVSLGHYDDSDWRSEVFCYYMPTTSPADLHREVVAWWEANQALALDRDLDDPRDWKVGR